MKRISLDCMGGDYAPKAIVQGAVLAAAEFGLDLLLVGEEHAIGKELSVLHTKGLNIEIVPTTQVIGFDDAPALAVRRMKDSSMVVAHRLVKEGKAEAVFSAGNTGAIMACGLFILGRMEGVQRPALAPILPTVDNKAVLLLDSGANAEAKAEHLLQFGLMGSKYMQFARKVVNPRVGLINIGTEEEKGSPLYQEAYQLLKKAKINFVGNLEARELFSGAVDVAVCDGFTGNVILKLTEGLAQTFSEMIKQDLYADLRSKMGGLLIKPAMHRFKNRLDYSEYGAAPLLGVNGICLKGHGSSEARAIYSALRAANEFIESNIIEEFRQVMIQNESK